MNSVILGMPGAGKSTVAHAVADLLDVHVVASGDVARQLAAADSNIRHQLSLGMMAEEAVMRESIRTALEKADLGGGWVLDGFPRTVDQLCALLAWVDPEPTFVLIQCEPLDALRRIGKRNREHDLDPMATERRMQHYLTHTRPMIDMLLGAGAVTEIYNGDDTAHLKRSVRNIFSS